MKDLFTDGPDNLNPPAIVQQADVTAASIHEELEREDNRQGWFRAEKLWQLKEQFGETDDQIGNRHGWSQQYVNTTRRVWELFGKERSGYNSGVVFKHCLAALAWDNADECLNWAAEMDANVAEMKAWRRSQNGEDLTVEADPPETVPNTGGRTEREAPESRPVGQSSVPAVDEPVDAPRAAEPKLDKAPAQKKKPAEATPEPVKPPGIGEAIEAVTRLADELRDEHERKRFAGHLRKQADLLDPPRVNGKFVAPTVYEVSSYATENSLSLDGQAFVDFYESKGWLVGRVKMKDWRAAARNWSRRDSNGTNGFSANRSVARVAPIDHGPERIDVDYTTGEGVEEDESFDPSNPFGV